MRQAQVKDKTRAESYRAIMTCMRRKITTDTQYNGCRPNSSLRAEVKSGVTPYAITYADNPTTACDSVHPMSLDIELYPMVYDVVAAAIMTWRFRG